MFAEAINEGFSVISSNIKEHNIKCDYEEKQGFLYAEDEDQEKQLKDVYEGCVNNGVEVAYTESVPTPVAFQKALVFNGQAQFHPIKYLKALQSAYQKAGGIILENTRVISVESKDEIHEVNTGSETIRSKNVIYATHIPLGLNIFSMRCAPYRSYVIGVTLADGAYPDALIYDMQEPYHYFRTHTISGKKYLIAGGNDHKTGHDDPDKAFNDLESYLRKHYKVSTVKYKWSSQYYVPVDGLPYIGQMPGREPGIFCATGFNGNGMMLGSVAATILADLVSGKKNKYEDLFAPARIKPIAGFKEFISENADVAYQFVASRMPAHEVDFLKRIKKDTGNIVEYNGKKMAVYRDKQGNIHALDPVCTHASCIVKWNADEKSWDCPCHGARYDINGEVLNGPADINLKKITFDTDEK